MLYDGLEREWSLAGYASKKMKIGNISLVLFWDCFLPLYQLLNSSKCNLKHLEIPHIERCASPFKGRELSPVLLRVPWCHGFLC